MAPDRQWQKQECVKVRGKAGDDWDGQSCVTELTGVGARGSFLWRQWFWEPPAGLKEDDILHDACTTAPGGPRACLQEWLRDSGPGDLIVLNMGLLIAAEQPRLEAQGKWFTAPLAAGGQWPWLEASIRSFVDALEQVGRVPLHRVVWANAALVLGEGQINARTIEVRAWGASGCPSSASPRRPPP